MKNAKVSFFANAKITKGTETTIQNFVDIIKKCDYEDTINKVRAEQDPTKRNELKQNLPCITVSGLFEKGRSKTNLSSHSGFLQVDFDKIANLSLSFQDLKKDNYTSVLFTSPSGTGLKVFVKIEPNQNTHLASFEGLEKYYKEKYALTMDKSTKDICRLCYVSSDKKIFVNENAETFYPQKIEKKPQETPKSNVIDFSGQDKYAEVERILDKITFDITSNREDWLKIGFAFAHQFGENGRNLYHKVSRFYPKYTHEETEKQFDNCLRANTGQTKINTFFDIAKNYGVDISLPKNTSTSRTSEKTKTHSTATKTAQETDTIENESENGEESEQTKKERINAINELKEKYVRVGTKHFKRVGAKLEIWDKKTLLEDFAKFFKNFPTKIFDYIPKYDSFINQPENLNYKQVINNCLNIYEKISHTPKDGDTTKTHAYLKHLFTDKYEVALDYLTILFRYPTQLLPIICLVSETRSTGKTTFLNWLKKIYKSNCAILGNEDFKEKFNAHYATKNVICVDETFVENNKNQLTERIKKLVTTTTVYLNMKGIDSKEINFYGKIIMCSNRVKDFIKMDKQENRFFVNVVPTFEKENPNLEVEICQEIPAFLYELTHRIITHPKKTRFWFDYNLYETQATKNVKEGSKSEIEYAFSMYVNEICENAGVSEFKKTIGDITEDFEKYFKAEKFSKTKISLFLRNDKKLVSSNPTTYQNFPIEKHLYSNFVTEDGIEVKYGEVGKTEGRVFLLKKEDFKQENG